MDLFPIGIPNGGTIYPFLSFLWNGWILVTYKKYLKAGYSNLILSIIHCGLETPARMDTRTAAMKGTQYHRPRISHLYLLPVVSIWKLYLLCIWFLFFLIPSGWLWFHWALQLFLPWCWAAMDVFCAWEGLLILQVLRLLSDLIVLNSRVPEIWCCGRSELSCSNATQQAECPTYWPTGKWVIP